MQTILVLTQLERYIQELGYTALRGKVNPRAASPSQRRSAAGTSDD